MPKKRQNLTGRKFTKLTVINDLPPSHYWNCICECGNKTKARTDRLLSGMTKSCGCHMRLETPYGKKFGRLTVISEAKPNTNNRNASEWKCMCDCGTIKTISAQSLIRGRTKSCGCFQKDCIKNMKKRNKNYMYTEKGTTELARLHIRNRTTLKDDDIPSNIIQAHALVIEINRELKKRGYKR